MRHVALLLLLASCASDQGWLQAPADTRPGELDAQADAATDLPPDATQAPADAQGASPDAMAAGGMTGQGGAGMGGMPGTGGAPGMGGAVVDPLAPYPSPTCPGVTVYPVPRGTCIMLAAWSRTADEACNPGEGMRACRILENSSFCSPNDTGRPCDGTTLLASYEHGPGAVLTRASLNNGDCPLDCP